MIVILSLNDLSLSRNDLTGVSSDRQYLLLNTTGRRTIMGKITFIEHDQTEHVAEFKAGSSVMQIAVDNLIPGIDGDCGGECACGTCHVIVSDDWFRKTGTPGGEEEQMLSMTPERASTSRLGCQVVITDEMDGMTVHLPEFQM
jgi:2Fe-2S ferredoxin